MNEQEWLASVDPRAMLAFVEKRLRAVGENVDPVTDQTPSDRKLRLFACGCCRQVWDGVECGNHQHAAEAAGALFFVPCQECGGSGRIGGLADPRSRRAVEVAEKFADGRVTDDGLLAVWNARRPRASVEELHAPESRYEHAADCCCCPDATRGANVAVACLSLTGQSPTVQASLLRDVFAPFLPVVREGWQTCGSCNGGVVDVSSEPGSTAEMDCPRCDGKGRIPSNKLARWLAWNDGCVKKLASSIYKERDFGRMPLLADALSEAGCEDAAILSHCRGSGPHVRGCWVADLLLGKS